MSTQMTAEPSSPRQRTTVTRHLKPVVSETPDSVEETADRTVGVAPDSIRIDRYDKPLRSLRETFFVTNCYSDTVAALSLTLRYEGADGKMLHSRRATIECEIPPGETRQLHVGAWDRQFTYYYRETRIRPKSKKAYSYDVVIIPESVVLR